MRRNQIELYAMQRGMSARQAARFADDVLSRRNRPENYDDLNMLIVPFAVAAGITLLAIDAVGGIVDLGLGVAGGVVELGLDAMGGLFSIFD